MRSGLAGSRLAAKILAVPLGSLATAGKGWPPWSAGTKARTFRPAAISGPRLLSRVLHVRR